MPEGCLRAAHHKGLAKTMLSPMVFAPSPSRPPPGGLRPPLCFDSQETGGARFFELIDCIVCM